MVRERENTLKLENTVVDWIIMRYSLNFPAKIFTFFSQGMDSSYTKIAKNVIFLVFFDILPIYMSKRLKMP